MTNAVPVLKDSAIELLLPPAFDLLYRLGITANYKEFCFAAYTGAL